MKILAMDSSGMTATVAVVEDDRVLAEYTIDYKKTHSQTLLPMLKEAGDMIELDLDTVDAIAVAGGSRLFYGPADRFCHGKKGWGWRCKSPWCMYRPWREWRIISGGRTGWSAP